MTGQDAYPYVWAWKGHGTQRQRCCLRRQGQRCRVIARSRRGEPWTDDGGRELKGRDMNSALIEFEDGYRTVTSRNGLRRAEAA